MWLFAVNSRRVLSIVFIWLLSVWPTLNFVAANYDELHDMHFDGLPSILLLSIIVPSLLTVIALAVKNSTNRLSSSIIFALASVNPLLFLYGDIHKFASVHLTEMGLHTGATLTYIAIVSITCSLLTVVAQELKAMRAFVLIATVLVVGLFGEIAVSAVTSNTTKVFSEPTSGEPVQSANLIIPKSENIYYFIFDSYPGPKTTSKIFKFDNPLPTKLRDRGFFDAGDVISNYLATFLTVTSILATDYAVTENTPLPLDKTKFYPFYFQSGFVPGAFRQFQKMGYQTYFIGNWYARCPTVGINCLRDEKVMGSLPLAEFLAATPVPRFVRLFKKASADFDLQYDVTSFVESKLQRLASQSAKSFVFAHNLPPHPPVIYNSDCTPRLDTASGSLNWAVKKDQYLDGLICVNRKILKLIDEIDVSDPKAIVVIESDHGSFTTLDGHFNGAKLSAETLFEMSHPINFVRAPEACRQWLYSGMTQINMMRFVLGCAKRQRPQYVVDKSYVTRGEEEVDGPYTQFGREPKSAKDINVKQEPRQ